MSIIALYASKPDAKSLICFLSSHGNATSLQCQTATKDDCGTVEISDILSKANTPQLKGCPKIFFIDACRTPPGRMVDVRKLPEIPDDNYFIGFSTLNGSSCKSGNESCGLYIETLIDVFEDGFSRPHMDNGKIRDLSDFMRKVHHVFSKKRQKDGDSVQMPTTKSSMTKIVFLHACN